MLSGFSLPQNPLIAPLDLLAGGQGPAAPPQEAPPRYWPLGLTTKTFLIPFATFLQLSVLHTLSTECLWKKLLTIHLPAELAAFPSEPFRQLDAEHA